MQEELNQFERNKVWELVQRPTHQSKVDRTHFRIQDGESILLVQIYVDDIIFGSKNKELCDKFSNLMQGKFEMSMMGELTFFLGLQVKQMKDGTFISQTKYTIDLMKKFGMEEKSSVKIPMNASVKMDMDADVGVCARFQSAPKESHMTAAKRIIRYLKGCQEVGLRYPKEGGFKLIGYSDSDYDGCRVDRKSTSYTCQMLGNRLVSWFSKKQNSIATSTGEAEYIAAGCCCAQVLWMRQQLRDYDIEEREIPIMRCLATTLTCSSTLDLITKPSKSLRLGSP
ncbi:hypothetical protein DH2020_022330 [Rehmannia glutinosa]|uniref:Reverse transcriptase Ty1/copia-type domain-containing protein n=1 Tax=Rehmannia glutinosa TaxID=99300 RepID=A0ABR0WH94_REHGL